MDKNQSPPAPPIAKPELPEFALVYDFDGTLIEQESIKPILQDLKLDYDKFWQDCDVYAKRHGMDSICAYLLFVFRLAKEHKLDLSREYLNSIGSRLNLRPAVYRWFETINLLGEQHGFKAKHYVITSGIADVVEGHEMVKRHVEKVFGSRIHKDEAGDYFPSKVVNYTNKTQYIFRISKGLLNERDEYAPNYKVPVRAVPIERMIFIGDGFTDVPCFALMKEYGGTAMALLGNKENPYGLVETLVADDRVDYLSLQNHFEPNGVLYKGVKNVMRRLSK